MHGFPISGTINGGAGNDTLDYSAYATPVTVDLSLATATDTGGVMGIETVIGGSGDDAITGDGNDNLLVGNAGKDTLAGLGGDDTLIGGPGDDQLIGGPDDDTYIMADDGSTDTLIELAVGGTNDTVDYSAFASPVTVDLQAGTAPGTAGIANIETFIGGTASDTLVAPDAPNSWGLLSPDGGTINWMYYYLGFEHLVGGNNTDTFYPYAGGSVSGSIDGRAGVDALDYSLVATSAMVDLNASTATLINSFSSIEQCTGNAAFPNTLRGPNGPTTWNITVPNGGTVGGAVPVSFARFGNLNGGAGPDSFIFADGMGVSGPVNGGGKLDTLDYSAYTTPVSVNLQTGAATGTGGFANVEKFIGGVTAGDILTAPEHIQHLARHFVQRRRHQRGDNLRLLREPHWRLGRQHVQPRQHRRRGRHHQRRRRIQHPGLSPLRHAGHR